MKEIKTSLQNRRETLAPHPMLADVHSVTAKVYTNIKINPGITVPALAERLRRKYYTIKSAVTRLKDEGLVIEYPHEGRSKSKRPVKRLRVVSEHESNYRRDKLTVDIIVSVNDYGEYSIEAFLDGELPSAKTGARVFHSKTVKLSVPRPVETFKTRQIFHEEPLNSTSKGKTLTIEGEIIDSGQRSIVPVKK
jgi:hypothetical protein